MYGYEYAITPQLNSTFFSRIWGGGGEHTGRSELFDIFKLSYHVLRNGIMPPSVLDPGTKYVIANEVFNTIADSD